MTICVHHEELFGNVFQRKADKYHNVLELHGRKVKPQLLVSLEQTENPRLKGYKLTGTMNFLEKKINASLNIIN